MNTKQFHLGDVLSITTDRLVSPTGIDGVYEILDFMSGDCNFTHQLPRVADECKPYLLNQFPQLRDVDVSTVNNGNWTEWLNAQVEKYGKMFDVEAISMDDHTIRDPLEELCEMVGDKPIIVIDPDDVPL